ncbi:GNAT family N-acetyltransferase [Cucumibacter marinus]|uniref:GNAT family N-acetyltransferase n=1 Tax=Cucumibacter marinus TaxID=1121252 RepID=UPI0003F90765|nr:GNAT family N-acetyltransferase [Cucumibacter marinus]
MKQPSASDHAIRLLGRGDAAVFRDMRLRALKEAPEAFGASHEDTLKEPLSYFEDWLTARPVFMAFEMGLDGETPAGMVAMIRDPGAKMEHRGRLISMYVAPEARGTGLAARLVETVIAHALEVGVTQMHLVVAVHNDTARRFYERMGFQTYATEPRALRVGGRYIDEYAMVRFFDEAPKDEDNE